MQEGRADAELTTEPDLLATFELSYSALSEENQKRWRALGVFPASFALSATSAMWELEENEARKNLGLFRRYSLLGFDETASRYSLHDLLTDFALSQMSEDEEELGSHAHSIYFSKRISEANQLFNKGKEYVIAALNMYDMEQVDIIKGQKFSAELLEINQQLADACVSYAWQGSINSIRLSPQQHVNWLSAGLRAVEILEKSFMGGPILLSLGNAYFELGDYKNVIEVNEQALKIFREIGDEDDESRAFGNLGSVYSHLGETDKAIDFYERQLRIAKKNKLRDGEANSLNNLGRIYAEIGEIHKAIEFYEKSIVIKREIGDRIGEGNSLGNLGNAYRKIGDMSKAKKMFEDRLGIAREIGDRGGETNGLNNLGIFHMTAGNPQVARKYYEASLMIARERSNSLGEDNALYNLGIVLHFLGETVQAIELARQALSIYKMIGSPTANDVINRLISWGVEE